MTHSAEVLSWNIKRTRLEQGLSLRDVSELAGVAPSRLSEIENGNTKNPGIFTLLKIAAALDVALTTLLKEPGR